KTAATASREEILEALQTAKSGWCYLGNFSKNTWSRKTIQIGDNEFPKPDTVYQIIDDVYLRDKEPQPPNYTLGAVIGINREGGKIKIDKVVQIPDKDWVWAKVTVISQAQK